MKRILILPSQELEYVKKACAAYRDKHDITLMMVSGSKKYKPYIDLVGGSANLYPISNFYQEQNWQYDENKIKEIDDFIKQCEQSVNVPVNNLILTFERDIGRSFSKDSYFWAERAICRRVLRDNTIAYKVIRRMFYFARETLRKTKPDFCLGGLTASTNSMFAFACSFLRIPFVSCDVTGIFPKKHFWVNGWGSYNDRLDHKYLEMIRDSYRSSDFAINYIKLFREKPSIAPLRPIDNLAPTWKQIPLHSFYLIKYKAISYLRADNATEAKPIFSNFKQMVRRKYLYHRQAKLYEIFSDEALSKLDYVYYPMHVDPEVVLNLRAPFWHNQLNTIKQLANNLPCGVKLIVREYSYNLGRRPTHYLETIKQLPGVHLVSALDDQYKYIAHSSLVVTVNGTSGFEALLLKKPVITLSRTLYDVTGLTYKISADNIGARFLELIRNHKWKDYNDIKLCCFIDSGGIIGVENSDPLSAEYEAVEKELEFIVEQFGYTVREYV